ncbi:MAG: tetratricopeptide repeat protein, partial [Desulfobacterales bacterium]|nr:tetratricopeptide repeat protein [Desulfobacterales bacterium]
SRRATPGQVKTAYRHLARQWHPDRCAQTGETPGNAALKMREINLAREMLLAHAGHDRKAGAAGLASHRSADCARLGRYPEGTGFRTGDGPFIGLANTSARIQSHDLVKAAGHLLKLGRPSKSLAVCNRALKFDRGNAAAYNQRGAVFKASGRYVRALKDFSRAIKLVPDQVDALVNRGDTYVDLGRYNQAMADYDQALRLDPEGTRAFRSRARLLFKTRHYEKAVEDMRRALAL